MRLIAQDGRAATLSITPAEHAALCNALNEALEGLEAWEFETRMGVSRQAAERLLREMGRLSWPETGH